MKTFVEYNKNPVDEELAMTSLIDMISIQFDDGQLAEDIDNKNFEILDEGINDKVNDIVAKAGFHVKKKKGLIGHLMNAGKGVAKLFIALINKDGEAAKAVLKGLKKEDILDFLLDLDMATVHIISGPIHTLDAITGWHIWANVKEKAKGAKIAVLDAIKKLKQYLETVYDNAKAKVYNKYVSQMEKDLKTV